MSSPPKKTKSVVWSFFSKDVEGKAVARCNLCEKEYKTCGNTTNLINHLRSKHKSQYEEEKENFTSEPAAQSSFSAANKYDPQSTRQKTILRKLVGFIATDFQPISVVDDKGFRELVHELNSKFVIPSRRHISDILLPEAYQNMHSKLLELLSNISVCALTTDTWTSTTTEGYITVTCHFISSNKLMASVLTTRKIIGNHTAENLKSVIKAIMDEYSITHKVIAIVTDNASNIVAAVNLLRIKHMPCFAHTLNLVVKDALSANLELDHLIKRVKQIVTYFKSSTLASDKLRTLQLEKNLLELRLIQEVPTRWNTHVAMIRRYLQLREIIAMVLISLKNGLPSSISINAEEAEVLEELVVLLEPFENATREISGEQYPTMALTIPIVHGISLKLESVNLNTTIAKSVLVALKESISKRLSIYEKRTISMLATLLDPRFKKAAFRFSENAINAQRVLQSEVSSYNSSHSRNEMSPVHEPRHNTEAAENRGLLSFLAQPTSTTISQTSTSDAIISLRQYFEVPIIKSGSDPIYYWYQNKFQFGALANIGLQYCCIPGTSVPSERSFSAAGQILSDRRSRLKPNKVDMLVFMEKNQFLLD